MACKYFFLLCAIITLSGCGAAGRLAGNVTMLPIHAVKGVARAATYQSSPAINIDELGIE